MPNDTPEYNPADFDMLSPRHEGAHRWLITKLEEFGIEAKQGEQDWNALPEWLQAIAKAEASALEMDCDLSTGNRAGQGELACIRWVQRQRGMPIYLTAEIVVAWDRDPVALKEARERLLFSRARVKVLVFRCAKDGECDQVLRAMETEARYFENGIVNDTFILAGLDEQHGVFLFKKHER